MIPRIRQTDVLQFDCDTAEETSKLFNDVYRILRAHNLAILKMSGKGENMKGGAKTSPLKKAAMVIMMVCLLGTMAKATITSNDINFNTVYSWESLHNVLRSKIAQANIDIATAGSNLGTGKVFYVDSAVGLDTYGGTTPATATATLDAAVNLCTANRGDVIYVMQGHNESLIAADDVDVDIAGVTIIGLGNGSDRPRFDFDNADGEFVIGAAGVKIYNLTFLPSVTAITHCIDIENAGDYATIANCEFLEGEAVGTDEFIDCIQVGTTATDAFIYSNKYTLAGGTGANNFVDLSAATIVRPVVVGNVIYGEFAEAGIWAAAAVPTNCVIAYNIVTNLTTAQFGIEFQGAATGMCVENLIYTDAVATCLDPGSLKCFGNLGVNSIDESAVPIPAIGDTATNFIGVNDADNAASTSTVASNRDGSILERLEFLVKYFETGTAGALVAPANTFSILDILGSDGSATTGAVAGSLLGAIGTNEVSANTPFSSSTVQADADGSLLERLEFIQTDYTAARGGYLSNINNALLLELGLSEIGDKVVADMDANSATESLSSIGDKVVADMDANSILADLAGISELGDKIVADMDANSILADLAGISQIGDKVQVDLDANSVVLAAIKTITDDLAGISQLGDKIQADMDANSILADLAGISQVGDKVQADIDANSYLFWQERTIAVGADEVTQDLLDVQGGPILIKSITGIVTVEVGGNATTCKLVIDRDDAAADTEFTTAVAIQGDVLGTVYVFSNANPAVLTPLTPGASGSSNAMTPWFCPEGMLEQTMSADPGGAAGDHIIWYITYQPLESDVVVVAQ